MPTTPYDSWNTILNTARGRLNDDIETLQPISGELLDNSEEQTLSWCNAAFRTLQELLADWGYAGLKQDNLVLTNIPAVANLDPATQASITYSGYSNGSTVTATILLPQNMIRPYKLWERKSGAPVDFVEMDEAINGLPPIQKAPWNRQWEWRADAIFLPGAKNNTDIRIRYSMFLPDFADIVVGTTITPWFTQVVPIMRCEDSLADFICREVYMARQDSDSAAAWQASGEMNAQKILNRDTAFPKGIAKVAEYQKMAGRFTPNVAPDTQPVKRGA